MMAVLLILAGYGIVPLLVVLMKSGSLQERGGQNRFPAVEIL